MKNSDYKKLTNILRSLSQTAPLSSKPDYYIPTKQLVSAARDLATIAVDDIAAESLNQHQYTDDLVKAIKEFRSVQDAFSDSCRILFKQELWPILDNICPPEPYGNPDFVNSLIENHEYLEAVKDGRISKPFQWNGTITDLAVWVFHRLNDFESNTDKIPWRYADKVFIWRGERVTKKRLNKEFNRR